LGEEAREGRTQPEKKKTQGRKTKTVFFVNWLPKKLSLPQRGRGQRSFWGGLVRHGAEIPRREKTKSKNKYVAHRPKGEFVFHLKGGRISEKKRSKEERPVAPGEEMVGEGGAEIRLGRLRAPSRGEKNPLSKKKRGEEPERGASC